jgi:hypothetical protein
LVVAVVVVITEVVAVRAASDSFTLSTVEQERDEASNAHVVLRLCAVPLLAGAAAYWTVGRSRVAGILLAVAAVGTALGLWTWMATAPLALAAVVVAFFRKPR